MTAVPRVACATVVTRYSVLRISGIACQKLVGQLHIICASSTARHSDMTYLLQVLEGEAHGVVALCEGLCVVDAAGKVVDVQSCKRVDLSGIAAYIEEFWILKGSGGEIHVEIGDGVLVADGALVPVIGNALVPWVVFEIAGGASDGEEGLERLAVEITLGVFSGLVGHEAVDEGVRCR